MTLEELLRLYGIVIGHARDPQPEPHPFDRAAQAREVPVLEVNFSAPAPERGQ